MTKCCYKLTKQHVFTCLIGIKYLKFIFVQSLGQLCMHVHTHTLRIRNSPWLGLFNWGGMEARSVAMNELRLNESKRVFDINNAVNGFNYNN